MAVLNDPVFMISSITIVFAFLKHVVTYLYKSKCETVTLCCGMIKTERNVNAEVQLDRAELEHAAAPPAPMAD